MSTPPRPIPVAIPGAPRRKRRLATHTRETPSTAKRVLDFDKPVVRIGTQTVPITGTTLVELQAVMERASQDTVYGIPFSNAPHFIQAILQRFHTLDLYLHPSASQFLTALLEWYEPPSSGQSQHDLDDDMPVYFWSLPFAVQQMYLEPGFATPELVRQANHDLETETEVQCKGCLSIWDGNAQCLCGQAGCGQVVDTNVPLVFE
jgi:hypothetical protein